MLSNPTRHHTATVSSKFSDTAKSTQFDIMNTQQIINVIGLTFDIIGVLMLFKYGLPSDINKNGHISIITTQVDNDEIHKYKKYKRLSYIALSSIIIGFILQALSTIWTSILFKNV